MSARIRNRIKRNKERRAEQQRRRFAFSAAFAKELVTDQSQSAEQDEAPSEKASQLVSDRNTPPFYYFKKFLSRWPGGEL